MEARGTGMSSTDTAVPAAETLNAASNAASIAT